MYEYQRRIAAEAAKFQNTAESIELTEGTEVRVGKFVFEAQKDGRAIHGSYEKLIWLDPKDPKYLSLDSWLRAFVQEFRWYLERHYLLHMDFIPNRPSKPDLDRRLDGIIDDIVPKLPLSTETKKQLVKDIERLKPYNSGHGETEWGTIQNIQTTIGVKFSKFR
jgi:hypothetical protein